MLYGFNGKLLRVNLSTGEIRNEAIPDDILKKYLGGAGVALHFLLKELDRGIDPLGEKNKLVFSLGPGAGVKAPGMDMHMVLSKSPLTGGVGESQTPGWWGPRLKKAGWDMIIIEGRAMHPSFLVIDDDRVELRGADYLWGKDTHTVQKILEKELGKDFSIAQIGPAGENLVRFASIVCDLIFINNRMGMGAVMGSKNLKAIAVRGTKDVPVADEKTLEEIYHYFEDNFLTNPLNFLTTQEGIASAVPSSNQDGLFSVRNAQTSFLPGGEIYSVGSFSGGGSLESVPCFSCPARCKKKVVGNNKIEGHYGAPSMESIVDFGFTLDLIDPDFIFQLHEFSRKYGFDTTSSGVTLGFLAECFEKGLISKEETRGIEISFGKKEGILPLLEDMVKGKGWGNEVGKGVKYLSSILGKETIPFALEVKGKEIPLHEPRVKQMLGLGYAISPSGPDTFVVEHDTDFDENAPQLFLDNIQALGLLERLPAPSLEAKKVRMFYYLNQVFSFMDALGLCIFAFAPCRFLPFSLISPLIQAITGWEMSLFRLMKIGETRIQLERLFNLQEGIEKKEDWLPERFFEPVKSGPRRGLRINPQDLKEAIELFYSFAGWNIDDGFPERGKLEELALTDYL